jgi:hypothetical protein
MSETRKEIEARLRAKMQWMAALGNSEEENPNELPHNAFVINTGKIYYFLDYFMGSCNALLTQTACSGSAVSLRPPPATTEQKQGTPAAPPQMSEFDPDIELTAEAWTQIKDAMKRPPRRLPQVVALLMDDE